MNKKRNNFKWHYPHCEELVKKYKKYIENGYILDIGSNIGFFSDVIVKKLNYNQIHLFEPCIEYFNNSKKSLEKYENIYFNNFGLGNKNEEKILYKSTTSNIGWNTFLKKDPNQKDNFFNKMDKEKCIIKKLDDYKINNVDFIKIDVEGYEYKVLEGGMNLIKKFKPFILIEVGWGTKHPYWEKCKLQYDKLFDIGYERVSFKNITEDILFKPKL